MHTFLSIGQPKQHEGGSCGQENGPTKHKNKSEDDPKCALLHADQEKHR